MPSVSDPRLSGLDGFLLVDKPAGMTSHDVVDAIRRRFQMRRVGHGGTLDPAATGLLILLVGRATRKARFLLNADKTYLATLRLGVATDTQDREGKVLETKEVPAFSTDQISAVCQRFQGEIEQEVPAYSAARVKGKRFYDLARSGQSVPRRVRRVTVRTLEILEVRLPEVDLKVTCSSGTYVRTLCADLGTALGCGGHLDHLSRTHVGPFSLDRAVKLEAAERENLVPLDELG